MNTTNYVVGFRMFGETHWFQGTTGAVVECTPHRVEALVFTDEAEARKVARAVKGDVEAVPCCPDGCENTEAPWCHCGDCGRTGVPLGDGGLCGRCLNPPPRCRYCAGDERASCCTCV